MDRYPVTLSWTVTVKNKCFEKFELLIFAGHGAVQIELRPQQSRRPTERVQIVRSRWDVTL